MSDTAVCWIHDRPETYTEGSSFKACGECWHVWQTEREFRNDLAEAHAAFKNWQQPLDLTQVFACPLCTHDF